jgi:hypothetical protein
MGMRLNYALLLAAVLIFSSGCGATLPLSETRLGEAEPGRTFLMLSARFQGAELIPAPSNKNCELRIRNRDDGKLYLLPVKLKDSAILVEVVPGRYAWESLVCSNSLNWSVGGSLELPALVPPGKVGYAGRIRLTFNKKTDGETGLTAGYGARGEDAEALTAALKALPSRVRSQAVAAYSGKPVSVELIASRSGTQRQIAITKKGQDKLKTDELNSALDGCDREEQEANPVRLGSLSYELEFAGGAVKKLDRLADQHTYSDAYVSCVENALRSYKPGTEASVVYRIQL